LWQGEEKEKETKRPEKRAAEEVKELAREQARREAYLAREKATAEAQEARKRKADYLLANLAGLVYNISNSFSLGYYKLLIFPLNLYQVLDDPEL